MLSRRSGDQSDHSHEYDDAYYALGCGVPYERNEHWLNFFDAIARRIASDIQPRTVLDAGCAWGFLVEKLREYGVQAFGVDISEHALAQVHEDIRAYCWHGSVTEPLPQPYDLIVCIEVLEHLPYYEAETAVENFCRHADDILFASTPYDYKETTHINVHPPEYWAAQFARHGFYRDVDFDASFLSAWTVRYRRRRDTTARLVSDYERKFWTLWKENTDLRTLTYELRTHLHAHQILLERSENAVKEQADHAAARVAHHMAEKDKTILELNDVILHLNHRLEQVDTPYLEQYRAAIAEKTEVVTAMDGYIKELEAALEAKNRHIDDLTRSIAQIERGQAMRLIRSLETLKNDGPAAAVQTYRTLGYEPVPEGHAPHEHEPAPSPRLRQPVQRRAQDRYGVWIAENEPDTDALERQRYVATMLAYRPLVTVVTPVYNPPAPVLAETIESVLAQTYSNWELWLVDGGSTAQGVRHTLQHYAGSDERINLMTLAQNLGISGNLNEGLRAAAGEFVVVLDHDDLLAANMLYEVVCVLNECRDADILYYDEDKVSEDGTLRLEPFFKPQGWSPDLLLSTNYLMHSVVRRSLVNEVGGYNPSYDGAQDWDLMLRCTERTQRLVHIPKVLYHWRQVHGSASCSTDSKQWAFDAQPLCLADHLKRQGVSNPKVVFHSIGNMRVLWPVSGARVSIIILTRERPRVLRVCLSAVLKRTVYPDYEIILVDAGSTSDDTRRYYEELESEPRVRIVSYSGPFNVAAAYNLGVRHASGSLLLFMNNDVEPIESYWLDELVGWAERPQIGVVGCKMLRPGDLIQHAGVVAGVEGMGHNVFDGNRRDEIGPFGSPDWYRDYTAVSGACMIMRRDCYEESGGFDEAYHLNYSDIDMCLRVQERGYRVVYTPFARLMHYENGTRGYAIPPYDVLRLYARLFPLIQRGDPFFNPNLSYAHRRPAVAKQSEQGREAGVLAFLKEYGVVERGGSAMDQDMPQHSHSPFSILHSPLPIAHSPFPSRLLLVGPDLSAGEESVMLFMLAHRLREEGYAVTVLSPVDGPLHAAYTDIGAAVVIEPDALIDARAVFARLAACDMVLANTLHTSKAVHAARAFCRPCAWWLHQTTAALKIAREDDSFAAALFAADVLVLPGQATVQAFACLNREEELIFKNLGVFTTPPKAQPRTSRIWVPDLKDIDRGLLQHYQEKLTPLPYGFDAALMQQRRTTVAPAPSDRFTVLCPAAFEPEKGQDVLLQSVAMLPDALQRVTDVYFLGRPLDWQFYRELTERAAAMLHVHITPFVPAESDTSFDEVLNRLQTTDVVVLPSRDDALPIGVCAALYSGKAVLASHTSGASELIQHAHNGLIFKAGNYRQLAENLEQLFHHRETRRRLGEAAQAEGQDRLSIARFARELMQRMATVQAGRGEPGAEGTL